jgi:hypothetical protein
MKTTRLALALAAALALQALPIHAQSSAVPGTISYQGRVTNDDGTLVGASTPTNRTVIFRIWDNATGTGQANLLYSEKQTVTISKGEFSVLVGNGDPVTGSPRGFDEVSKKLASLADPSLWNGSTRFLGVTVCDAGTDTGTEVAPRQQIASTAYAIKAQTAEKIVANGITADMIAPNAITAAQLAPNTITATQLANGTITATQVAPNAITASKIANGTITSAQLAPDSITTSQIANGTITGFDIATNAIGRDRLDQNSVYTLENRSLYINGGNNGIIGSTASNDGWEVRGQDNGTNNGAMVIKTTDDGNEPIQFWQTGSHRMQINKNGNIMIPGDIPDSRDRNNAKLVVDNSIGLQWGSEQATLTYIGDGGAKFNISLSKGGQGNNRSCFFDGDSNWDFESDIRLKTDIAPAEPMLDRILGLPLHRFRYKDDAPDTRLQLGVLAQEVQPVFPELVAANGNPAPEGGNYLTVGLTSFGLYACKAIQELADRTDSDVENLHAEIAAKDAKIAELEARLAAIEAALKTK